MSLVCCQSDDALFARNTVMRFLRVINPVDVENRRRQTEKKNISCEGVSVLTGNLIFFICVRDQMTSGALMDTIS